MFKTLTVKDFRGLKALGLEGLGRVNLVVGTNSCGKTSLLEAVQLLALRGDLSAFVPTMVKRGEVFETSEEPGRREREAAIVHLFRGHEIERGFSFTIAGHSPDGPKKLIVVAQGDTTDEAVAQPLYEDTTDWVPRSSLELEVNWIDHEPASKILLPLSSRGWLPLRALVRRWPDPPARRVRFVTTASLTAGEVTSLFNRIVLTPEEDRVIQALRTIEPSIERVASVSTDEERLYSPRGGLLVKLQDQAARIPLGSLGDGVWRLLGLALSLVAAEGGVLLVDEIDTGLHHTVMGDMWTLVCSTAERLNVQVFATSHSNDCWTSLARITRQLELGNDAVSIQRIERGRPRAVAFTAEQMILAAEREIEVR